jgi:glycosyltransferase involved in cell wall biosynthesis
MALVSVCIPVYNGEKYIVETITSIQKQTFQDFEILIQDNKSTDDTWRIVLSAWL